MTNSQRQVSKRNHRKAVEYFELCGLLPIEREKREYILHHVDTSLRHTDIERYIQWNPDDLVVMTNSEHIKLHMELWGGYAGLNNPFYGHKFTDEQRKKLSDSHKGYVMPLEQKDKIGNAHMKKVICEETGKIYNSVKEAKQETGLTTISRCCAGVLASAGKLHWKYLED